MLTPLQFVIELIHMYVYCRLTVTKVEITPSQYHSRCSKLLASLRQDGRTLKLLQQSPRLATLLVACHRLMLRRHQRPHGSLQQEDITFRLLLARIPVKHMPRPLLLLLSALGLHRVETASPQPNPHTTVHEMYLLLARLTLFM